VEIHPRHVPIPCPSGYVVQRFAPQKAPHRFVFFAFDLLHLDGQDLRRTPLIERRAALRKLAPVVHIGENSPEQVAFKLLLLIRDVEKKHSNAD
jgi:ATP-dependent DNA ligase